MKKGLKIGLGIVLSVLVAYWIFSFSWDLGHAAGFDGASNYYTSNCIKYFCGSNCSIDENDPYNLSILGLTSDSEGNYLINSYEEKMEWANNYAAREICAQTLFNDPNITDNWLT